MSGAPRTSWADPAKRARLAELWADPTLSGRQIGDIMGLTKNTVLAAADHIGLPRRSLIRPVKRSAKPVRPPRPRPIPAAPQAVEAPKPIEKPVTTARTPRIATEPDAGEPLRVALPPHPYCAVGPRDCRWPSGDPRRPDFSFCRQPVTIAGRSYCDAHHAKAYERRSRQNKE
jgi:hypothetical protein